MKNVNLILQLTFVRFGEKEFGHEWSNPPLIGTPATDFWFPRVTS